MALDFEHPERAAEAVAEFARAHPLAAVVGADDETTGLAAAIAARLGLPHNPVAALTALRDKLAQRERLAAASVPVPRFTLARLDEDPAAIALRIGFPCVVKPRRLSGSRGVMRANDVTALAQARSLAWHRASYTQPNASTLP
jgi:biotin carboxylase